MGKFIVRISNYYYLDYYFDYGLLFCIVLWRCYLVNVFLVVGFYVCVSCVGDDCKILWIFVGVYLSGWICFI